MENNQAKQEDFMREAIRLSLEKMQEGFGGPFGSVIVRNGEIIARGYNNVLRSHDPTAHAEMEAIRAATQALGTHDLSDCELYASSQPCPMCMGAIYWARLKKVYFGNRHEDAARIGFDDSFIYEELEKPLQKRRIPMVQLLPEEAKVAFEAWEKKPDKQRY
ncbi:tRNA(Arg) A34 adenosine deaminase TadA [Pontibacter mucosus]|uniref:tRNA(Arg) A34 adenosine deaminase TadA n=1 Tax=Pontibacter mucosus TaxID=1649266 RepID=A0A2T5YKZ2_9BACT|nr:nucleoside deaminase [Pontibacter mucosus]PTX19986.1 tRNA(Arg) A34 adenosine deaminase TadA [Pontibacter mucosus]